MLVPQSLTHLSFEVVSPENINQITAVKELVWEYFHWGNSISIEQRGFDFNIQRMFINFTENLDQYRKPQGILFLIRNETHAIGTGGYRKIETTTSELKRMYIRETFRNHGLGSRLLTTLLQHAKEAGCTSMQLETANFMSNACNLYKKFGFKDIPVYSEVESPKEYRSIIRCMKIDLSQMQIS